MSILNKKKMNLNCFCGNKIFLRPITLNDTDLIITWRNNKNVKKNFIFRDNFTREMHEKWMREQVATGNVIQYLIEEKQTNEPIGSVYLRDIDYKNSSAEFGIFIGKDSCRGKGYGTEATQLFVDNALKKFGLHRIFLRVLATNTCAISTYSKVGFIQEGRFKDMVFLDNHYIDVIFMAIVDEEN